MPAAKATTDPDAAPLVCKNRSRAHLFRAHLTLLQGAGSPARSPEGFHINSRG